MWEVESPVSRQPWQGRRRGGPPANGLGPQIALESVNVIDAGETALVEGLRVAPWERGKGVAGLLQRFCSQLVKRQHPGVKVARLTRDYQLGPRELKKYRLITKQVRRTGNSDGWASLLGHTRRPSPPPAEHGLAFSVGSTEWRGP